MYVSVSTARQHKRVNGRADVTRMDFQLCGAMVCRAVDGLPSVLAICMRRLLKNRKKRQIELRTTPPAILSVLLN